MCNKLVSVIMSTYNTDKEYLKLSIESILNQTYTNLEFIIVNDGSEEDLKIISQYKDKRMTIEVGEQKTQLVFARWAVRNVEQLSVTNDAETLI